MSKRQKAFFRIDVELPCYYQILTREEAEQTVLPNQVSPEYMRKHFVEQLILIEDDLNAQISKLEEKSQLLANCMRALNQKLDFLMQTVDDKQLANTLPIRKVNLSANGIALEVKEPISMDHKVDIIMRPLKNELPVAVRCDVVHIKSLNNSENSHWVGMSYQNITEENQRKLIYFIQTKEIEQNIEPTIRR